MVKAEDDNNEIQLANIGDRLKFVLNLKDSQDQVKTSPQSCYATKFDGGGRHNLIENRYCMEMKLFFFQESNNSKFSHIPWVISWGRVLGLVDNGYVRT